VTKEEFIQIARLSIRETIALAEKTEGKSIKGKPIVKFFCPDSNGNIISEEEFMSRIFIDDAHFYRIIDLAVTELYGDRPVIFARISGHPPGSLKDTWNGLRGPFKTLAADKIRQITEN